MKSKYTKNEPTCKNERQLREEKDIYKIKKEKKRGNKFTRLGN